MSAITTDTPVTRLRSDLATYLMRHEGMPILAIHGVQRHGLWFVTVTTPRRTYEANAGTFEGAVRAVYDAVRADRCDRAVLRSLA